MRAVVQRVSSASVDVADSIVRRIDAGVLIYLGVGRSDTEKDADYLAEKIANLRIFEDHEGKMNLSLLDRQGQALIVSQFTLYGDSRKGRRPSFTDAAPPEEGERLFKYFVEQMQNKWKIAVETGIFREYMIVHSVNEGPVTMLLDSSKIF
ncbi:D-aminoacyl-tRNA deacylase [Desulfitibacter alkalitolerans]|uniref:D-aminoacyl-tRNA deacylase n=1 Tax=Desulfitibacter alkalitolerans TaxID=264641 RepID=UPI000487A537|nr:D-aminoacyl-tRNA deacylase [Desulfitibacter alkalitolerans]